MIVTDAFAGVRRIDDLFLKTLVLRQYHEYLRWFVALPELEKEWPAWREASGAVSAANRRGSPENEHP